VPNRIGKPVVNKGADYQGVRPLRRHFPKGDIDPREGGARSPPYVLGRAFAPYLEGNGLAPRKGGAVHVYADMGPVAHQEGIIH
jgi:hypothetical protein